MNKKFSPERDKYVNLALPYTMTQAPRLQVLWNSIEMIRDHNLRGSLVELGVYKGGSSMLMAYALKFLNMDNHLFLFDTFKGMPKPTEKDVKISKGNTYFDKWEDCQKDGITDWCYGSLGEVRKNMSKTKYDNVSFFKGLVEDYINKDFLRRADLKKIALLRIDTDFYESTKHIMEYLFPLVEEKGFVIFDDYYCWQGARDAVDEYFENHKLSKKNIVQIDHSCAMYQV